MYLTSLLRITCTESGDPEPNVTWTKNGTYFVNNNTFTINNVTLNDAGRYGCTAENRAGKINATLWIDVIGKENSLSLQDSHTETPIIFVLLTLSYHIKSISLKIELFLQSNNAVNS